MQAKPPSNDEECEYFAKTNTADMEEEISWLENAIASFLLGANLPVEVMTQFLRWVWGKKNADKIVVEWDSLFLMLFHKQINEALKFAIHNFDWKPLTVKQRNPNNRIDETS